MFILCVYVTKVVCNVHVNISLMFRITLNPVYLFMVYCILDYQLQCTGLCIKLYWISYSGMLVLLFQYTLLRIQVHLVMHSSTPGSLFRCTWLRIPVYLGSYSSILSLCLYMP